MSEPRTQKNDLLKKIFFFLEIHKQDLGQEHEGYSNLAFQVLKW